MKKVRLIRLGNKCARSIFTMVLGMTIVSTSNQAMAQTLIKYTRHNLSSSGLYTVKAPPGGESQICIFCHAPHNADSAQAPLWNHAESTASSFQMASTANVSPNRVGSWADPTPTGISKKCLSCHDGTVAVGALANAGAIPISGASGGSGAILASGDYGFVGTDLRGGHVISFKYDDFWNGVPPAVRANYNSWNTIITNDPKDRGMFDRNRKMQCHSCHDPHNDWCNDSAKTVGRDPLWRKPCDGALKNDEVCRVCHINTGIFKAYSF